MLLLSCTTADLDAENPPTLQEATHTRHTSHHMLPGKDSLPPQPDSGTGPSIGGGQLILRHASPRRRMASDMPSGTTIVKSVRCRCCDNAVKSRMEQTTALGDAPVHEVLSQRVDDAGEPVLLRAHCGQHGCERAASVCETAARLTALADGHEEELPGQAWKDTQELVRGVEIGDLENERVLQVRPALAPQHLRP